jgi:hypothetical protein
MNKSCAKDALKGAEIEMAYAVLNAGCFRGITIGDTYNILNQR